MQLNGDLEGPLTQHNRNPSQSVPSITATKSPWIRKKTMQTEFVGIIVSLLLYNVVPITIRSWDIRPLVNNFSILLAPGKPPIKFQVIMRTSRAISSEDEFPTIYLSALSNF